MPVTVRKFYKKVVPLTGRVPCIITRAPGQYCGHGGEDVVNSPADDDVVVRGEGERSRYDRPTHTCQSEHTNQSRDRSHQ